MFYVFTSLADYVTYYMVESEAIKHAKEIRGYYTTRHDMSRKEVKSKAEYEARQRQMQDAE